MTDEIIFMIEHGKCTATKNVLIYEYANSFLELYKWETDYLSLPPYMVWIIWQLVNRGH